ncbi:hypothetical protein CY34DRAFT_199290 [Suillus luteus UH-Slu-Lm8-n1]|uniref:Uncharacterized protein n=1 Tax=Suillus luteus UH-Slu-Lm8-n1 TaxID=930992 RepID=A0A0D0B530_9AGAM|nr:hypothetical protein CY34DRAFT_199290 [Suillus luteus UH-Slu-Lm8-n1]
MRVPNTGSFFSSLKRQEYHLRQAPAFYKSTRGAHRAEVVDVNFGSELMILGDRLSESAKMHSSSLCFFACLQCCAYAASASRPVNDSIDIDLVIVAQHDPAVRHAVLCCAKFIMTLDGC